MTIKREHVFIRDYRIVAAPFEIDGAPLMVDGYVADPALWQPLVEELAQEEYEQALREHREDVEMLKNSDNVNIRKMAGTLQKPVKPELLKPQARYLLCFGIDTYTPCRQCDRRMISHRRWDHFCSNKCSAEHINERRKTARPSRAKVRTDIDCQHCNQAFTPARSDAPPGSSSRGSRPHPQWSYRPPAVVS